MTTKLNTPWGFADTTHKITDELLSVSTPSHGGYLIDKSLAERLIRQGLFPASIINNGFIGAPFGEWYAYEEDCAYAVLAYAISLLVDGHSLKDAYIRHLKTIENHYPLECHLDDAANAAKAWYPDVAREIDRLSA